MGRARPKQRKFSSAAQPASSSLPPIASLVAKAQDLIVQCDYPLACKFLERILSREDGTPTEKNQAREMMGVVLLELAEVDAAKEMFLSLVPPHPDAPSPPPPSAYLHLAQLSDDDPRAALSHYQTAIDLLHAQLKGKSPVVSNTDDDDDEETKSNIVRAYLGMIEIWMDPAHDLCFDPAASPTCDALLSRALEIDPQNLETLQTLASVRLSQEKPEEALQALRTFSLPDHASTDLQTHKSILLNALPIPVRIARAKLLLECGAYSDALSLLEGVLATDDANVEGWYLMGWSWWLLAERRKEGDTTVAQNLGEDGEQLEWQDMARDSRDCLETCRMLYSSQGFPDEPLMEHVQELITTLEGFGIHPSPADEEENGEVWEDVGDSDEDVEMSL
ncbi:hypothetical protein EDD17DRAFT_1690162 [Pisolithus thermaeus]|nr:hypothetical protein EV401DRAFT_1913289 [Pisolithus croceorrhizus]KAI6165795.1 hypothetical protein EDD17DRAFT_1690162 [Pisolithus thermaeus]